MSNSTNDVYLLGKEFEEGLIEMIEAFESLGYRKEDTDLFLDKLMIIFVRGLVCIEKLKSTQNKYGKDFNPSAYDRKDLICDMEKVSNIYKLYTCFSDYLNQRRSRTVLT